MYPEPNSELNLELKLFLKLETNKSEFSFKLETNQAGVVYGVLAGAGSQLELEPTPKLKLGPSHSFHC